MKFHHFQTNQDLEIRHSVYICKFCWSLSKYIQNLQILMETVLPHELQQSQTEIGIYFLNSIGDPQRIDYGSGHELNFVMWLYCLEKLGVVGEEDYVSLVLRVFRIYHSLLRRLQMSYWLEPAGSHGVWGLDDYHFLPFLWGSSQLINHKYIRPKSICNSEVLEGYADEYMYLGCIRFINEVKVGSFFEHSPLLFDISGARNWEKVNEGMIKMFKAEVLGKLPIMKHFFFGTLISFEFNDLGDQMKEDECCNEHEHEHVGSQEKYRVKSCCVQRIPSPFAAKSAEQGVNH